MEGLDGKPRTYCSMVVFHRESRQFGVSMESAWFQEFGGPGGWISLLVALVSLAVGVFSWLEVAPMTAAAWFLLILFWSVFVGAMFWSLLKWPNQTAAVCVVILVSLVVYWFFFRVPALAPPESAPASSSIQVPPRQGAILSSSTSLTALELMDLMAAGTPDATAIAQSQEGLSLQIQGQFSNVMIMPEGPTSEIWDTRPSQLAARFMVALEYDDEFPTVPKRVVYVYVTHGHEQEAASIPSGTEVVARGTIERISPTSINIREATILPIQ